VFEKQAKHPQILLDLALILRRAEAAELSELFSDRGSREMLQAVLGRSNPRYVTPADLDFNFPPEASVMQSCKQIINSGHAWRGTRSSSPPLPDYPAV